MRFDSKWNSCTVMQYTVYFLCTRNIKIPRFWHFLFSPRLPLYINETNFVCFWLHKESWQLINFDCFYLVNISTLIKRLKRQSIIIKTLTITHRCRPQQNSWSLLLQVIFIESWPALILTIAWGSIYETINDIQLSRIRSIVTYDASLTNRSSITIA